MTYISLIIWFFILIKWADILVSGASSLAKRFWISTLVIGLTIVAFGTSAPELFVNVLSGFKWQTQLALGNVIGSNIANVFLILWVAAIIYPLKAKSSTIYKEIPFSLLASFALFFLAFDTLFSGATQNIITRGESLVLLLLFIVFFAYTFGLAKDTTEKSSQEELSKNRAVSISLVYIIAGLVGLWVWAHLLISSATTIALNFWVQESVIGLTVIAFGTSLPELATAIVASLKRDSDIAIGSVVGSNIFNLLLVLGATGAVKNIIVPDFILVDILVELGAIMLLMLFLFVFWNRGVLTRGEGAIFLALYFVYMGYILQTQVL